MTVLFLSTAPGYLCTFNLITDADRFQYCFVYSGLMEVRSDPLSEPQYPISRMNHCPLYRLAEVTMPTLPGWKTTVDPLISQGNITTINLNRCPHDWIYDFVGLYMQKLDNRPVNLSSDTAAFSLVSLAQNYPNPFNPITTIRFYLTASSKVKLSIYKLKGQLVNTLINDHRSAENHAIKWNVTDLSCKSCATGLYLYKLETPSLTLTKKMMMLK